MSRPRERINGMDTALRNAESVLSRWPGDAGAQSALLAAAIRSGRLVPVVERVLTTAWDARGRADRAVTILRTDIQDHWSTGVETYLSPVDRMVLFYGHGI